MTDSASVTDQVPHIRSAPAEHPIVDEDDWGARTAGPAPPASEQAARTLLRTVLGPDGIAGVPLVTHAEIAATATELTRHLLQVDDCWVQPAGAFTESLGRSAGENGGAWLGNPSQASAGSWTTVRFRGALGGAPFLVGGERRALVVFTSAPRAWTRADHVVLRQAAAELGAALEATLGHQRTPTQEARQRYDELRNDLLTVLNHELRTPLTGLGAGVELLAEMADELPPGIARLVARMEPNLERLMELSANVTALGDVATPHSRVDAARFQAADVRHVVQVCLDSLGTQAERVEVRLGAGDLLVAVPEAEVRELLDRVLNNALKFSGPDGEIVVDVERRTSRVTVVVSDTGPGVPEHEEHAVGQPFFRATNAWVLEKQGAGLGLAAATRVARRWGGVVELRNGAEGGAVVTVRLPAAESTDLRGAG